MTFGLSIQQLEKKLLEEALQKSSGNVSEASRLLKMTPNTLRYRMVKYHLQQRMLNHVCDVIPCSTDVLIQVLVATGHHAESQATRASN